MARKCKSCEISLFPMAKRRKKRSTRRRRRVGSSCSCKGLTVGQVVAGAAGGIGALAVNGIAKKLLIDRISNPNMKNVAQKALPVVKTVGAIYGSKKVKGKNAKAAVTGFGIVSGVEVALQVPFVKKYASLGNAGAADLFSMIGSAGDVVYLPIDGDGVDNNEDFFTEESVVMGGGNADIYTDIATL